MSVLCGSTDFCGSVGLYILKVIKLILIYSDWLASASFFADFGGLRQWSLHACYRSLVGTEIFAFRERLLKSSPAKTLKELDTRMIPPAGVKRDFFAVDGTPYDEVRNWKFNIYNILTVSQCDCHSRVMLYLFRVMLTIAIPWKWVPVKLYWWWEDF